MNWRRRAACRGLPTALWFGDHHDTAGRAQAHAICATCPAREACLTAALTEELTAGEPPSGIRGGVGSGRRTLMLRELRAIGAAEVVIEERPVLDGWRPSQPSRS